MLELAIAAQQLESVFAPGEIVTNGIVLKPTFSSEKAQFRVVNLARSKHKSWNFFARICWEI